MPFDEYFEKINASSLVITRYEIIRKIADTIIPPNDIIEQIFITNEKAGNTSTFKNLYLFSKHFMLESKNFLSSTINLDIIFYEGFISRYEITSRNFNFETGESTDDSWITVTGNIENIHFLLNAVGSNCEQLWRVITDYIAPNIYYEITDEETNSE